MARKTSSLEAQLDRLADLRAQPSTPEGRAEIGRCLGSKMNLVVAKAARIAGEWEAAELTAQLVSAFDRFLVNGAAADKRCAAKIEILKALNKMEHAYPAVYRAGIGYVQMEASWGEAVDTAAEVRALSAMGLAQTDYRGALEEIVPLLVDPERDARIGAVRAIGSSGLPGDTLLLRLKALSGDAPEVVGECCAALLRAEPEKSIGFVGQFLERPEESVAEAAALALGESRLENAFEVLRKAYQGHHSRSLGRALLVALALLRRESAIDYLLDLARNGTEQDSADACAALALYEQDPQLRERLARARDARKPVSGGSAEGLTEQDC
ncbi:MAG TPA: HEAT repeat domain-containing protein [Bryobacteraceae bacterium]|nr:HEAT repeat domain-containing protein [Bryobacteraceae bacterium]